MLPGQNTQARGGSDRTKYDWSCVLDDLEDAAKEIKLRLESCDPGLAERARCSMLDARCSVLNAQCSGTMDIKAVRLPLISRRFFSFTALHFSTG